MAQSLKSVYCTLLVVFLPYDSLELCNDANSGEIKPKSRKI